MPEGKFEQKMREFFKAADVDNNGWLCKQELLKVLTQSGDGRTAEQINDWYDAIDKNNDDQMTLEELETALTGRDPNDVQESELRAVFQDFDKDGSGKISVDELKQVCEQANANFDVNMMMDAVDKDDDGKVSFEEFIKMWKEGL